MEFREVTAILHGATVVVRALDFSGARLVVDIQGREETRAHEHEFQDVELLRWKTMKNAGPTAALETVGLEKLGAGEVWRLYAQTTIGAELELSCRRIECDGAEVTGIGRSYRH
jgi:hypothetical protein